MLNEDASIALFLCVSVYLTILSSFTCTFSLAWEKNNKSLLINFLFARSFRIFKKKWGKRNIANYLFVRTY